MGRKRTINRKEQMGFEDEEGKEVEEQDDDGAHGWWIGFEADCGTGRGRSRR